MDDIPIVTIHPGCGFDVDEEYQCPLEEVREFTLADAQKSATKGCPYCIFRYVAMKHLWPELPDSAKVDCAHNYIFLYFWVQSQRVVLAWLPDGKGKHDSDEEPVMCSFHGQHISGINLVEHVAPCNTRSTQSFQTIYRWIKRCDEEHECMRNLSPKLPRRLLDVRNNHIRLHEPSSEEEGARYACLSHRWGNPSTAMFRTTSSTLHSFKDDIPWTSLPRTFQDAISVTRRLNLGFIWIDALCIVQDDVLDWQRESADMATIYQNAYITLAATESDHPNGGCYTREESPRSHRPSLPLAVVRYQDGTERELFVRSQFSHSISSLPLLQRGWVFQERVLSPRMLHFAGEELVWECGHEIDCECGSEDLENKFEHPRIQDNDDENNNSYMGSVAGHPYTVRPWMQVVTDYTALSLTHSGDVFPALSGIAKAFAAQTRDQYVAGMWKRTLVPTLLWYFTEDSGDSDVNQQPWRAPSWSWASVYSKSGIRFLPFATQELAEVKDIVCQPVGADPTGELATGYLTLRTKAIPARVKICPDKVNSGIAQYAIDLGTDFTIPKASESFSLHNMLPETAYLDLSDSRLSDRIEVLDVILVQISSAEVNRQVWLYGIYQPIPIVQEARTYLVLAKQATGDERWARIGLASITDYEPNISLYSSDARNLPNADKEKIVQRMTEEDIKQKVEEGAERNRRVLRLFDEALMQDITIW